MDGDSIPRDVDQRAVQMSTQVEAIKDALKRWVDAINARRADEVSKLVSDDVVFIHPPAAPFAGRVSIVRLYWAAFQVYGVHERLQYEDIRVVGDALATARVTAHIQLKPSRGGEVFADFTEADAMRFRRQSNGAWKLVSRSLNRPSRLLAPFSNMAHRSATRATSNVASSPSIGSLGARRHEGPDEPLPKSDPAVFIPSGSLYRRILAHGWSHVAFACGLEGASAPSRYRP